MYQKGKLIYELLTEICKVFQRDRDEILKNKNFEHIPLYENPFYLNHIEFIYLLILCNDKYGLDFINSSRDKNVFYTINNIADFINSN